MLLNLHEIMEDCEGVTERMDHKEQNNSVRILWKSESSFMHVCFSLTIELT